MNSWISVALGAKHVSCKHEGFPHSDIYGLTLARQLPVAYRSRAASFIASLESRHPPYALKFLIRKFVNHFHQHHFLVSRFDLKSGKRSNLDPKPKSGAGLFNPVT